MGFGYRDSLQRKGQRNIRRSVDERVEPGYGSDIGTPCRTTLPQHPTDASRHAKSSLPTVISAPGGQAGADIVT